MRTWGRVYDVNGKPTWVKVETDSAGFNDEVMIVTLAQTLKLNLGESPFYANYGIPAHPSVVQQIAPDFYVQMTQQQYAQFFASLALAKTRENPPTYQMNIITQQGARINATVPIPT